MNRAMLAKIHIAKKALGLTDEVYRDLLYCNFRVESAKDLAERDGMRLLELLKVKGWKPRAGKVAADGKKKGDFIVIKPGPVARQQRKVLALWNELGYAMEKLHARCRQQFGVDRFEWVVDYDALHVLITDLEKRLRKARV